MANWKILMNNLSHGGFAPKWYSETYPSFGNKNQAGAMVNIDMTNPGYIQQGPGLANLTNGTQANAEYDALIKGIWDGAVTADATYGTGGDKLHKISSTALAADATWAHSITHDGSELGEDVAFYKGELFYSYNDAGSIGCIGKYDLSSTFDDDWSQQVPSGKADLQSAPHQMVVGGNDVLYISNGRYVASWDDTTFIPEALDIYEDAEIQSIAWNQDRVWMAANRPDLTGSNKITSSIFAWDGTTNSWELEIKLMGAVGALHVKNGILFVFYTDQSSTGGFKLGYVSGAGIKDLANFTGALPAYYQVTDYKDFLVWDSAGLLWAYGSGDVNLPVKLFQFADAGLGTTGGVVAPFGELMVASNETTNYRLAQFSGLDVTSSWKSINFDITGTGKRSRINQVRFNFETLATGASVAWKLLDNAGRTIYNDTISFAKLGAVTTANYYLNGKVAENFRVELDYAGGSTTNSVSIKNIKIDGESN